MPLKVEFLFDFGSPNAYLADLVLPGRRIDVPIEHLKFKETQNDRRMSHADHA